MKQKDVPYATVELLRNDWRTRADRLRESGRHADADMVQWCALELDALMLAAIADVGRQPKESQ